jgi:ATP-binding cassette subfamily A (ABC1) protein 3
MSISAYWIGNYIYDFILYLIVAVFSVVMCQILKIESLTQGYSFTATCLLFLFYGMANISLTYILGYLFKDYGNAQGAVYFFNFVTGGILTLIILVLRWIDTDSNKVGRGIAWALRIIPSFSFGEGLVNMGSVTLISTIENKGK